MEKRPLIGVGVLIRNNKKILMGKRIGSHGANSWAPPGGHLEFNEQFSECVRREVLEETNLTVKNITFGALTNDIYKNEDKHYVTIFMTCDLDSGDLKVMEPNKCIEWKWFSWTNLPIPLFLSVQNLLQQNFSPFK